MIHHGDQEIEKDDDVDQREAAEHDETPEPGELFDPCQLKVVQIYQTKSSPKQSLRCLPQTMHDMLLHDIRFYYSLTWRISCKPGSG